MPLGILKDLKTSGDLEFAMGVDKGTSKSNKKGLGKGIGKGKPSKGKKKNIKSGKSAAVTKPTPEDATDIPASVNVKPHSPNCKVLGYVFLTRPAYEKVIDPVTVGCVFYDLDSNKYFFRVRKLMFQLHYLQNFISLDPNSG